MSLVQAEQRAACVDVAPGYDHGGLGALQGDQHDAVDLAREGTLERALKRVHDGLGGSGRAGKADRHGPSTRSRRPCFQPGRLACARACLQRMTTTNLSTPEPDPIPNEKTPVWELVIADMRERDASGRAKYGVPLQPFNGRKALVDAYQEQLDFVVYMRQALYEQEARARTAELIQDERDTLRGQVARLRAALERKEQMDDQTIEERDHAHDQLDAVLTLLGWEGEWTNAMPQPRYVAAELLAAKWVPSEQHERAVERLQQAEAMCAERTRERDAMERRALAAEASLARARDEALVRASEQALVTDYLSTFVMTLEDACRVVEGKRPACSEHESTTIGKLRALSDYIRGRLTRIDAAVGNSDGDVFDLIDRCLRLLSPRRDAVLAAIPAPGTPGAADVLGCATCRFATLRFNSGSGCTTCEKLDDLVVAVGPLKPALRPEECPLDKREPAMPAADKVVEQVQSIKPQLLVEPGVCGVVWGNLSERGFDVVECFGLTGVGNEAVKELASQAATAGDWRPDGQWLAVWLRTPPYRSCLQGPWFYHDKTDIMAWMRPAWVVNKAGDLDPALVSKIAKHVFEAIGAARAKV